ncbi:hypothetical protein [Massilia yuzhufengensis]|uniref:Protein TonB, links inner and outer membranes n=1 Tax=Massilia yuzhufengensis TaxID=1164594 RepID=A0A1I1W8N3_9BURK|nr:hypothetical protein [Massilia yuzhufengensis]SFD91566.1 hypothetical protein SAMN05216204_14548 [Massilia yuzhufengensis]
MRDHSHIYDDHSDVCAHCGQALPGRAVLTYGRQGPNRPALAAAILLHLLLVAIWLFQPDKDEKQAKPASGDEGQVVYVAPLQQKPKAAPREEAPKPVPKPSKPVPRPIQERIEIARLPDTITTPPEEPVKEAKPQEKFDQEQPVDMQAFIEARRRQRGATTSDAPAGEESEASKGLRNARANIAAINGRGREDRNESGGVFSISNKTFHSMDLKFRGWNPNFQRRWLTSVTVEQGSEPDIEIAVVKKMIELIRKEKTGDFEWDSHRLGRIVKLSARPQDTDALMTFLFKEMFAEYKPPPQWR